MNALSLLCQQILAFMEPIENDQSLTQTLFKLRSPPHLGFVKFILDTEQRRDRLRGKSGPWNQTSHGGRRKSYFFDGTILHLKFNFFREYGHQLAFSGQKCDRALSWQACSRHPWGVLPGFPSSALLGGIFTSFSCSIKSCMDKPQSWFRSLGGTVSRFI